jgi:nitrite reductase/ring-hydroxylating ferredoxin subunit
VSGAPGSALEPALLDGLIDYAGIFPPAERTLADAVGEYRKLVAGPHTAIVGPFLVRSGLLDELDPLGAPAEWPIGVVVDGPLEAAVTRLIASERRIVQIELRLADDDEPAAIADQIARIPTEAAAFVEAAGTAPIAEQVERIARLARARTGGEVHAKLRTGGVAPGSTVPDDVLAGFMAACREHGLSWKATAGLHQPLRHLAASIGQPQHGFLNVLAAAWLVEQRAAPEAVAAAIAAERLDGLTIPPALVRRRMLSFGSCSIDEPVAALAALGLSAGGDTGPDTGTGTDTDRGWVDVAACTDVAPGATFAVEALGSKLVAFRTHAGAVHVLGRFCTHLGANLVRLGKVDGDRLHCTSHHWAYDVSGRCGEAPGEPSLPDTCLAAYPTREIDGRIQIAPP